jgi:aspartate kinase
MLIVMKFGGTSVKDFERIRAVAARIDRACREGHRVVAVVSAMAGETDRMIKATAELTPTPEAREVDLLLSSGERIAVAYLAIALNAMGRRAKSFTGRQSGIVTDTVHTKARISRIDPERLLKSLDEGFVAVVAGFQGITGEGDVTTLGRGGSDLTAVAVAAAVKADVCEIYTDVEGVYTTDPNIVPEARKLERVSFEEMLEMASLGAKVLQTRSVEFAMKYNVPILVRSSFNDAPGTLVTAEDRSMENFIVSGVTYTKNQAKITVVRVPDRPGIAATIFSSIAGKGINVDMIVQNVSENQTTDLSFTVDKTELPAALETTQAIAREVGAAEVRADGQIAKVSIVGVGMRSHAGVASAMFKALAEVGVNIQMISTSEIKISVVIDAKFTELAVRVLHDVFRLSETPAGQ